MKDVAWATINVYFNQGIRYESLVLYFANGRSMTHSLTVGLTDKVLKYIWENCPDVAVGDEKELLALFKKKDFAGMKEFAKTQRLSVK
jgi:hypothetical protein